MPKAAPKQSQSGQSVIFSVKVKGRDISSECVCVPVFSLGDTCCVTFSLNQVKSKN